MAARPIVAALIASVLFAAGGVRVAPAAEFAPSYSPVISLEGQLVAFASRAGTLIPEDTNGTDDVFVHDGRRIHRVSVASGGAQGDAPSFSPALSGDGRLVAFESEATTLAPADGNGFLDVFLHDRSSGTTRLVSRNGAGVAGNGRSFSPAVSASGNHVAFGSEATNLAPGDTNATEDVFVHDVATGVVTVVSTAPGGAPADGRSFSPALSADGRWVAFASFATNLVPGDTNDTADVFVHDRVTQRTARVGATEGNGRSFGPSISDDGRRVSFVSFATNLVPGDTNEALDAFVHDLATGETVRVSVAADGTQANDLTFSPTISGDGRVVAYKSDATNLVAGDGNRASDVFVHDLATGATTRVSLASDGTEADDASVDPSLSGDGRYVAFASYATNLAPGDTNEVGDVFLHDRETGETRRLSVPAGT